MAVVYEILNGPSKLMGEFGELVASSYLKKLGFIVRKPHSILDLLYRVNVPRSYEVGFLRRYSKTMDFFAVLPRSDPLVLDREAICEVFRATGLHRFGERGESRGYVVEVKTGADRCTSRPSRKQIRMFRVADRLGFGVIVADVSLKENYVAEIVFRNEAGEELFECGTAR